MDGILMFVTERLGTWGIVLYFVIWLAQYFKAGERQALVDLYHGVIDTFYRNPVRRFKSERARIEAEYKATGRIEKKSLKIASRVASGTVEDALNIGIDVAYVLVPFIVTVARKIKEVREKKK